MDSKLRKEIEKYLSIRGTRGTPHVWACPFPRLELQRVKVDQCVICRFFERVRVDHTPPNEGGNSLLVHISLRRLTPAVVGMLRKKVFEYGKGRDSGQLTRDFSAIVKRRVIRTSGFFSSENSDSELDVCGSLCGSESGDHVSIRPNNGHIIKLIAQVNSHPATTKTCAASALGKQTGHTSSDCCQPLMQSSEGQEGVAGRGRGCVSVVRKDRRKRRRQAIEEDLDTSSDDENPMQTVRVSSGSVSPRETGRRQALLSGERSNSSMEDSGYPQSVCGSERVQELQSPCAISVSEDAFSTSTSPMEFLSPATLTEGEKERGENGKNIGQAGNSGDWTNLSLAAGNEGVLPDLDVLLTATNIDPETRGMFEPEDLVVYNEARGQADENIDVGLDSAFSTVDVLDKLNEKEMSVGDTFLHFDVQGLCNSMFSLEDHISGRGIGASGDSIGSLLEAVGKEAVNSRAASRAGSSRKSLSSCKSKKKKARLEESGDDSSGMSMKDLPGRTAQTRFGRKIVPSWKVRSRNFPYDKQKEKESVKIVLAQSKSDHDSQKWEEIESALQNWKKLDSTAGYFRELSSDGLSSLKDIEVDLQMDFDQQIFDEVINAPLPAVANGEEGETNTQEEEVDITTVDEPSDKEREEETCERECPSWVEHVLTGNDQSSNDAANVLVVVKRNEKSNGCCEGNVECSGGKEPVKLGLKKVMVHLVRLKRVPRRSDHFELESTSLVDVTCKGREEDTQKEGETGGGVESSGSNVDGFLEWLGEANLPEVAANCEGDEGRHAVTRLDKVDSPEEIINIMDAEVVPFSVSDLPLEPALLSTSVPSQCLVAEASPNTASPNTGSSTDLQDVSDGIPVSDKVEAIPVGSVEKVVGGASASAPASMVTASPACNNSLQLVSLAPAHPTLATPPLDSVPPLDPTPSSNEILSTSDSTISATHSSNQPKLQVAKQSHELKKMSSGTVKRLKKKIIVKKTATHSSKKNRAKDDETNRSKTSALVMSITEKLKSPPGKLAPYKQRSPTLCEARSQQGSVSSSPVPHSVSLSDPINTCRILSSQSSSRILSGKSSPRILSGKSSPKILSGKSSPMILSGKSSPKILSGKSSPRILSGKSPPRILSGKPPSRILSGKPPSRRTSRILSGKPPSKTPSTKVSLKFASSTAPPLKVPSSRTSPPKIPSSEALLPKVRPSELSLLPLCEPMIVNSLDSAEPLPDDACSTSDGMSLIEPISPRSPTTSELAEPAELSGKPPPRVLSGKSPSKTPSIKVSLKFASSTAPPLKVPSSRTSPPKIPSSKALPPKVRPSELSLLPLCEPMIVNSLDTAEPLPDDACSTSDGMSLIEPISPRSPTTSELAETAESISDAELPLFSPCPDEDFIDIHVDDEYMFADVEENSLDMVLMRGKVRSPMAGSGKGRRASPESSKNKKEPIQLPGVSVKERLGCRAGAVAMDGKMHLQQRRNSAASCSLADRLSFSRPLSDSSCDNLPFLPNVSGSSNPANGLFSGPLPSPGFLTPSPSPAMSPGGLAFPANSFSLPFSNPPQNMTLQTHSLHLQKFPSVVPNQLISRPAGGFVDESTLPAPQNNRFCFNYLMASCCSFGTRCKYQHLPLTEAPINVLEYFVRVRPIGQLSPELVCRYSLDSQSTALLKKNFCTFVKMLLALINHDCAVMINNWLTLTSVGVRFNLLLLCRVLVFISKSSPHSTHARTLVTELMKEPYQLVVEDYLHLFEICGQLKFYEGMKQLYEHRLGKGFPPHLRLISEVAKHTEPLGDWVFGLLKDIKLCASHDLGGSCKVALQLLNSANEKLFASKEVLQVIMEFLEVCPSFCSHMHPTLFRKICQPLQQSQLWPALLRFLECNAGLLLRLPRSAVCNPLERLVKHVGVSERLVAVVEQLAELHKKSLNCETWEKVVLWCAENKMAERASSLYRSMAASSKQLSSEGAVHLVQLLHSLSCSSSAMVVLRDGLHRAPPVVPPHPLLTAVVLAEGVINSTQDVYPVVTALIQRHVVPPEELLEVVLRYISKEKCYSKVSELVRLSLRFRVKMGQRFYQRAAAELKQWGQDPDTARLAAMLIKGGGGNGREEEREGLMEEGESAAGVVASAAMEGKGDVVKTKAGCEGVEIEEEEDGDIEWVEMDTGSSSEVCLENMPTGQSENWARTACSGNSGPFGSLGPVATVGESSSSSFPGGVREPSPFPGCPPLCHQSSDQGVVGVAPQSSTGALCATPPELLQLIQTNGRLGQFRAVTSILVDLQSTSSWYDDSLVSCLWDILSSCTLRPAAAFSSFLSHLDSSRLSVSHGFSKLSPGSCLLSSDRWLVSQLGISLIRLGEQKRDLKMGYSIIQCLRQFGVPFAKLSQPPSNLPLLVYSPPTPCGVTIAVVSLCLCVDNGTSTALEILSSSGADCGEATPEEACQRAELVLSAAQHGLESEMLQEVASCLEKAIDGKFPQKLLPQAADLLNKLLSTVLGKRNRGLALRVYESIKTLRLQCRPRSFSLLLKLLREDYQSSSARELCVQAIANSCYAPLFNCSPYEITFPPGLEELETRLLLEDHMRKLHMSKKGGKRNVVVLLAAGSQKSLEQVVSTLSPPLKLVFEDKDHAVITGDCIVQWRAANPSPSSSSTTTRSQPSILLANRGMPQARSGGVPALPRKVKTISACVPRKQQQDAVCREFGALMKPHRSKFTSEADYKHLIRLLSAGFFKTSQMYRLTRLTAITSPGETWELSPAIRKEIGQIVAKTVSKFTLYSMDKDKELGLC